MLLESPRQYTRETLRAAIVDRFGEQTLFFTCSAEGMTAEQLIDFLEARQKFVTHGAGKLEADPSRLCDHDGDQPHEERT
jgi:probable metal-binding protein